MVSAERFIQLLEAHGFNFFAGVPCSLFGGAIQLLERRSDLVYVPAVREDEALGIATGGYLAGKQPAVFMQNSGLGNCLNVLTSLNLIYLIPALIIMSWRGFEGKDAPEHIMMGRSMQRILSDVGLPHRPIDASAEDGSVAQDLAWALEVIRGQQIPAVLLLKKGVLC